MTVKREIIKQLTTFRYDLETNRRDLTKLHEKQTKLKRQLASFVKTKRTKLSQDTLLKQLVESFINLIETNTELSKENKESLVFILKQHIDFDRLRIIDIPELQSTLAYNSKTIKNLHIKHNDLSLRIVNLKEKLFKNKNGKK